MSSIQKQTLAIIIVLGSFAFSLFFWPNNQNAADEQMLLVRSQDEPVIYPIVLKMLSSSQDIHEAWGKLIIYGDYHYGYPFYFLSFLVLLPVKLFFGDQLPAKTQLNLMLLRQFISVLPIVIGAGLMTYLQTRFRSRFKTGLLFCFLLSIGGIVRNNINWWHPDALAVLTIILTLFFLDKDHLKFGRYFYLAAACCGLATAIKFQGLFFAPAVLIYLIYGWGTKRISTWKMITSAGGFVLIMSLVSVLCNPFLFYSSPRQRFLDIQLYKTTELSQGYTHDDPTYYQKGPFWWLGTLKKWYGNPLFWVFSLISLFIGSWRGKNAFINRLILLWVFPISIYLLYFVAVKPDHYWLPVVLPFFSVVLNIPIFLGEIQNIKLQRPQVPFWRKALAVLNTKISRITISAVVYCSILVEWVLFLQKDIQVYFSFINIK